MVTVTVNAMLGSSSTVGYSWSARREALQGSTRTPVIWRHLFLKPGASVGSSRGSASLPYTTGSRLSRVDPSRCCSRPRSLARDLPRSAPPSVRPRCVPRFGVQFSPWSQALGGVRVLWCAPLSSITSLKLEPEGIRVSLASAVEFSTDYQVMVACVFVPPHAPQRGMPSLTRLSLCTSTPCQQCPYLTPPHDLRHMIVATVGLFSVDTSSGTRLGMMERC